MRSRAFGGVHNKCLAYIISIIYSTDKRQEKMTDPLSFNDLWVGAMLGEPEPDTHEQKEKPGHMAEKSEGQRGARMQPQKSQKPKGMHKWKQQDPVPHMGGPWK